MRNDDMKYIHDMLTKFDAKLDEVADDITDMKIGTAGRIQDFEHFKQRIAQLEKEFKPVKRGLNMVHGILAFLGVAATCISVWKGIH